MGELPELDDLFRAADDHGIQAGESDYALGDLQEILRAAWRMMTTAQRSELFQQPEMVALSEVPEFRRLIGHLL